MEYTIPQPSVFDQFMMDTVGAYPVVAMIIGIIVTFVVFGYIAHVSGMLDETPGNPGNPQIICPHCQQRGHVATQLVHLKKGISGAKVVGGLLTGGVSVLGTGLSRKEAATRAHCSNCGSTWHF